MKNSKDIWSNKIIEIKSSPKKWHRDLLYLLEKIYPKTKLEDIEFRDIVLYESFTEAKTEIEQKAFFYFTDP